MNADLFPNEPAAIFDRLGDAYLAVGDKESATESFKKSLALDPGDTGAIESLRRLQPS